MVKAFLSRSKSTVNHDSASDAPTARSQPRPSSSSTVFPSLLKLDTSSSSSKTPSSSSRPSSVPQSAVTSRGDRPAPLVSLKLTAPSFLDVVVRDRESKQPVYIIETVRDSTSIYRLNPEADEAIKVSTVQWPNSITRSKFKSGRSVLMANDRWREAEELLKLGPLGSVGTRKFNIPHYPHSFKWKLIPGGHFYCSTAGANGPFAILDSSVLSAPARLSIFHNCLEEDDTRTQESYRGIPVLLLDYLVTTCLLLVTDVQEWMDRQQTPSGTVRIPGSSIPAVKRWLAIIHNQPLPPSAPTHSESVSPAETTISSAPWGGSERRISTSSTSPPVSSSATTTPPTPSTPGTSLDYTMARPISEEIPPVPPLPTSPPEANIVLPYLYTHPSSSAPHLLQGLSTPSTSSSPGPSSSSIRAPRRLPKPPILPLSPPPPPPPDTSSWHTVNEPLRTSEPGPSTSALVQRSPSPSGQSSSSGSLHSRSRSSRGSMGRLVSPPSLPSSVV
ncbi:hypothetical protein QCA50_003989 [Cerrena zonata]|uniref:Uncharacterized protein n=1 Tax=Cerrena zonata TaxID=2478898 RepID=A0AAW0GS46_9APHY